MCAQDSLVGTHLRVHRVVEGDIESNASLVHNLVIVLCVVINTIMHYRLCRQTINIYSASAPRYNINCTVNQEAFITEQ